MTSTVSNSESKVIKKESELRKFIQDSRNGNKSVGLVPTMGALHQGHLSLVKHCNAECDVTVVSIFVNPTQFAPEEDLAKYPRTLDSDIDLLGQLADIVFVPSVQSMYPPGFSTLVSPPAVSKDLEGEFRAEHFQGVATVVLKLLNLATPHKAYFGQKDYQQVQVIRAMVDDLNVPVEVVTTDIMRDKDGLALSSRNRYLNDEQRRRSLALSNCLNEATAAIRQGETDGHVLMAEMKQNLIDGGVSDIDYAVVADPETLKMMETITLPAVLLIAAHIDQTRLIDNAIVEAP